jgi:hypothetical protein
MQFLCGLGKLEIPLTARTYTPGDEPPLPRFVRAPLGPTQQRLAMPLLPE